MPAPNFSIYIYDIEHLEDCCSYRKFKTEYRVYSAPQDENLVMHTDLTASKYESNRDF